MSASTTCTRECKARESFCVVPSLRQRGSDRSWFFSGNPHGEAYLHMTTVSLEVFLRPRPHGFTVGECFDDSGSEIPKVTKGEINHRGGELRNETFGISLSIPPGALAKGTSEVITLTILTEKPESLKLQEDDMIVSCGFECSPPGLKFLKPVRLKIPHCAFVFNTSEVEPVLYLGGKDGRMTRQMTPSKSIVAGETSFAVSLKQLSYGWPAIIQNRGNMGIVHLQCALYLPRTTRAHGRNTLDVVVYKDIKGLTKTEQYKQHASHLLITEKQFSSSVNVGTDMVVSYGSTEKHMEEKIIHLQEIWHIVSGKVIQIPLDIRDDSLIHLKATAGSIERCEIYMVFECIHKDESQADWVQLQRSRRKRLPSSTSSIEYAGAGPCSSTTQDQPLQSGEETHLGDMIEKLPAHQEMPEDDGQKSHEPDRKNAKDSHRFVEKKIDHGGGEIQNETFGTLLFIPPGALAEGTSEVVGITTLTEKPESLILRRNEMIVSYGYRCSPFGLQFLKPVELTIPHCAVLTDPAKVETAIHLSDEHVTLKDGKFLKEG
ncbi:uncharacterized protein [Diadema setosum]|uniref:uncharacterized protein n=1 Tax=Diadema setosum TaxID=31175 RepID=UPI003B3BA396